MGLDITAYSNLRPVGLHTNRNCDNVDHVPAIGYSVFPESFRGIPILAAVPRTSAGSSYVTILGGCYERTSDSKSHRCRSGLNGYNQLRELVLDALLPLINGKVEPGQPFYELLWFGDAGTISAEASAKLFTDFKAHRFLYEYACGADALQGYDEWTAAFELAASGGLVELRRTTDEGN